MILLISEDTPIPRQMEKFWSSASNKTNVQQLARQMVSTVISGCVVDDEVKPALLFCPDQADPNQPQKIDELTSYIEEAHDRIVIHCEWQVKQRGSRLLVISNNSNTVMRLLCFFPSIEAKLVKELWVEYGVAERRRYLPIHHITIVLGERLCRSF